MQSETGIENCTYIETSRGGALMVELDSTGGVVRVQIEPEVNASWTADTLGERLVHLHTLALMRVRCDERKRMNERGADMPAGGVYPSEAEITAYRSRYIDF
jgi:DNA-binding protein YbaB